MKPHRNLDQSSKRRTLGLVAMLLVLSLVLSGCMAEGTTKFTDLGVGSVRVSQVGAQSTSVIDQHLYEYGLYYSTNASDVANIDPSGRPGWVNWDLQPIVIRSETPHVRVTTWQAVPKGTAGTATVDVKLAQGEKYYFRWYGLATDDADGDHMRSLTSVQSHVTLSHDASLKSIKTSKSTLSPKFSKTKYSYKIVLSASTKATTVTVAPTRGASTVQMTIAGSTTTGLARKVSVSKGHSKTLYIKGKATDGTTAKTYKVKISRKS
jgi:hypothetical protein